MALMWGGAEGQAGAVGGTDPPAPVIRPAGLPEEQEHNAGMDEGPLTVPEVAAALGLSRQTVNRAIAEGRLPVVRRTSRVRFGAVPLRGALVSWEAVEEYRRSYPLRPGRPPGSRDRYPRTRRTRVELRKEGTA